MTSSTTWAFSSFVFSPRMIFHFYANTTTNCIASEILNCRSLLSACKVPYFNFANAFLLPSSTLHRPILFKVTQSVLFCPYFIHFYWSWKFSHGAFLFLCHRIHVLLFACVLCYFLDSTWLFFLPFSECWSSWGFFPGPLLLLPLLYICSKNSDQIYFCGFTYHNRVDMSNIFILSPCFSEPMI